MNWELIKEKYPKAFRVFQEWGNHVASLSRQKKRLLYDFFDENEIWVIINLEIQYTRVIDEDDRNPHYVPEGFYYEINDNSYHLGGGGVFKTRREAETAAFMKAFEIFEEKLKN